MMNIHNWCSANESSILFRTTTTIIVCPEHDPQCRLSSHAICNTDLFPHKLFNSYNKSCCRWVYLFQKKIHTRKKINDQCWCYTVCTTWIFFFHRLTGSTMFGANDETQIKTSKYSNDYLHIAEMREKSITNKHGKIRLINEFLLLLGIGDLLTHDILKLDE